MEKSDRKGLNRPCSLKLDLAMKLTVFLLVVSIFSVQANVYSQKDKVTLDLEGVELKKVLETIESLTDLKFFYNHKKIDAERPVSVNVVDRPVFEVLDGIFQGTSVYYEQRRRQVILKLREVEKSSSTNSEDRSSIDGEEAQQSVSGTVTDPNGMPLPGANIVEKGTTNGTTADFDGDFSISLDNQEAILVVSYIGFATKEVAVNGQSTIDVTLEEDAAGLDEVVVIGYGTQRKADITGSVARVKGEDLQDIPNSRVDQILQGRASGVQITQVSGEPGAATAVRIRGGNSIQGNNEPLWVIDGIIVGQDFNLNNINTNDIESIDVLKDASSIAIYGTRGANGVILVTTKNGTGIEPGKPEIQVNISSGIQSTLETVDFLDGPGHAMWANEDAEVRSSSIPFPNLDEVPDVDWFDLVTEEAPIFNGDISIGGRSTDENINYYVSGNYFNQKGVIRGSGIEKYIFRANLDYRLSEAVKTGFRLNVSRLEQENNKVDLFGLFYDAIPTRAIRDETGAFTQINPISGGVQTNPEADIRLRTDDTFTTNFLGTLYLEVKPNDRLTFRSTFSPELNMSKTNRFNPGALPQNLAVNTGGDASINNYSSIGWNNENTVTYQENIGEKHNLTVLGGFTYQKFSAERAFSQAFGISNDVTEFNNLSLGSDPSRNIVGSDYDAFQLVSFLGRINYSFQDKYLVTLVGRSDGSSRFAPGNKYAFFPSGALAWRLSKESFIKDLDLFQDLKIRASYGASGSQAIESFRTLAILNETNTTFNGALQSGVTLGRPSNPDLKWETTRQFDIGLEASFFKGKLAFEIDYYKKNTKDLLLNVQIPRQTGFSSRLQNLGEVENKGLELSINSINVSKEDFQWSSNLNLSGNRNKVLDLAGADFINLAPVDEAGNFGGRLVVGQPAPVFVGVEYLGTWKSQEEIDASNQVNQLVGGAHFADLNGDGIISQDDYVILGNSQPDFIYGFGNSLSYKNWDFSIFFQGTVGNDIFNSLTKYGLFFVSSRNKYAETENRWSFDNPTSDIPKAGTSADVKPNSAYIEDGSHLRLKAINLSYTFPVDSWATKGIKDLSIYLAGTNLFVLSNFRLNDPETSQFGRDNLALGFANGQYPSARIINLGLKARF